MKNEILLKNKILGYSSPETIPVSFRLDGFLSEGLDREYKPVIKKHYTDSAVCETLISAVAAKGMMLTARLTEYDGFPVAEWGAEMTNFGKNNSELLTDFAITGFLPGTDPVLSYGNGDTRNSGLFRRSEQALTEGLEISPVCARGADGASPFMTLSFSEYSVKLGIGWAGQWLMSFTPVEGGVKFRLCQKNFSTVVFPGETMRTPNLTALFYTGDEVKGINLWRRFFLKHILPVEKNGEKIKPRMFLHTHRIGGYGEFEGITTENQLEGIDTFVKRGLTPDCWWIDAGWYPCDHSWWNVGDWVPNPEQLPDGFRPISEHLRKYGSELLVWFEPERVMAGSKLDFLHPEWCLKAVNAEGEEEKCRLLDYSEPECFSFMLELLDKHIKAGGIDIYRQDFNFLPDRYFTQNEEENRRGAKENLHIQAVLALYDELRRRNPGLIIDNCAAGGTRNEMDILRRSVPLQYTDMDIDAPDARIFHYYEMFSWIPYFRAHARREDRRMPKKRSLDEYSYLCAMTPALTVCLDPDDSEKEFNAARKMVPVWRAAAEYELKADFYRLSDRESGWYAVQFHDPADGSGFIEVIRTAECETNNIVIYPHIVPNTKYVFRNPVNGDIKRGDSTGLEGGFNFYNPAGKGEIWFYTTKEKDSL